MKKKSIIYVCVAVALIASLCIHTYLFYNEYSAYQAMYEKGKVSGSLFTDCEHTKKYGIDYSGSFATRKKTPLYPEELKKIHPTVWSYMFCCGHVQEKIPMWGLQEIIVWGIGAGVVVFVKTRKRKTERALDKEGNF